MDEFDETHRSEGKTREDCCRAQLAPPESMRRAGIFIDISPMNYPFLYDAAG